MSYSWQQIGQASQRIEELQSLERKDPQSLIKSISDRITWFQSILNNADTCKSSFDTIISLLTKVYSGLSDSDASIRERANKIVSSVQCTNFQAKINLCIDDPKFNGDGNVRKNLTSLCKLFEVLHCDQGGGIRQALPVERLCQTIQTHVEESYLGDLLTKVAFMIEKQSKQCQDKQLVRVRAASNTWDNSEYQTIQILPKWEEISSPKPPFQLRSNIVDGRYDDWCHYFDIQQARSQGGFGGSSRTPLSAKTMYGIYMCICRPHPFITPFKKKEPPFLYGWLQACPVPSSQGRLYFST